MADGVGAGIYCEELDLRRSLKLPQFCSIFQAESLVRKDAEIANNAANDINNINIYVDSQAEIKAIMPYGSVSENV